MTGIKESVGLTKTSVKFVRKMLNGGKFALRKSRMRDRAGTVARLDDSVGNCSL